MCQLADTPQAVEGLAVYMQLENRWSPAEGMVF